MRSFEDSSSSSLRRRRRIAPFAAVFALTFLSLLLLIINGIYTDHELMESKRVMAADEKKSSTITNNYHRKLLSHVLSDNKDDGKAKNSSAAEPNRIWSDKCSKSDVVISQGPTEPLPNGIPTYTVEIMNVGVTGCDISAIHLSCGWFSSARLVNPRVFKRLRFNDCLVNDGKPLVNGRTLSFQYANTFRYPLTVSSVTC